MTIMLERPVGAPPAEPVKKRRPPKRRSPEATGGRVTPGDWMNRAACRDEDPELFFSCLSPVLREKAKAVCASCPVRDTCLESALTEEAAVGTQSPAQNRKQRYGIRGALTSGERWAMAYPGEDDPGEADG
jgi:WhiB family redox-sensing transcriptional regulator